MTPSPCFPRFIKLADTLAQTPVPTKVILSIHTTGSDAWTHSGQTGAAYSICYKAGEACPLNHQVCDATYCEIDRWNQIITKPLKRFSRKGRGITESNSPRVASSGVLRGPT